MTKHEQKEALRSEIKKAVTRIKELKKLRSTPHQPGWQGSRCGVDLEQQKGLATLLCLARARMRNRRHVVVLPRYIALPPRERLPFGIACVAKDQASLDLLCDEELRARIPGYEPLPIPEPAAVQAA